MGVEDRLLGSGSAAVALGQHVSLRYDLRVRDIGKSSDANGEKVVERGEIECRLGESEVLDGWMDGNVDIEDVLAKWGTAVVGMQVGGKRRIIVRGKQGFGDGGGEVISQNTDIFFDVVLKKLH